MAQFTIYFGLLTLQHRYDEIKECIIFSTPAPNSILGHWKNS